MSISNRIEATGKWPPLRKLLPNEPVSYRLQVYHATLVENWKAIQSEGLIPGASGPSGQDWKGKWSGKATYFHQVLPLHEIKNGNQDGLNIVVIEVRTMANAAYLAPDEDVSLDVAYTPTAMKNKESIVYGYPVKPQEFHTIHLPQTTEARDWALAYANLRHLKVELHR